jgi:Zn-dependent peptidase ImmA (M78 family)
MYGSHSMNGFRVAPRSAEDIRAVANRAAAALGLKFPIKLDSFLERLTQYGFVLDVVDDNTSGLPVNVEACWLPETLTLVLKNSVYERACLNSPRELFTVFHELGHALLGHQKTINRQTANTHFPVYENSEWQADLFAAEILMPAAEIRRRRLWTPNLVMEAFGVSFTAAKKRIEWLEKKGQLR